MNEAQFEALVDRRVQARLSTDRDYLLAENAEVQALAERKIELQEELAVLRSLPTNTLREAVRLREIERELEQTIAELREA